MSHLLLSLRPVTEELAELRRSLRSFFSGIGEPADDWLLIATELFTNAIAAAPDAPSIEVEVEAHPTRVDLRVVDMGQGFGLNPKPFVSPSDGRGRGLMMVNALTDDFTVTMQDGRTTAAVSCRRVGVAPAVEARRVDVAVIGLGSAGEAASRELAAAGLTVAGFERHRIGGECPFVACMPSKSLLIDAHRARHAKHPRSAWPAAVDRREKIVSGRDDTEHREGLTDAGVQIVRADARLIGERTVEAEGVVWNADHVVLATGSDPIIPDVDGLDPEKVWSPFDALSSSTLPARVAIIGAGPVGCELADIYRSFGSDVVLFDHSDRLLPDHDAAVALEFEQRLRELGIDVQLEAEVSEIQHHERRHEVRFTGPKGPGLASVDQIIVAVGQAPRLADVGLENVGLSVDQPPAVDGHRRASEMSWLSVIGDVNGQNPWTHGANRDAFLLVSSILGSDGPSTAAAMPRATFTQPTAAHVGCAADQDNGFVRGIGRHSDIARASTDELDDGLVVVTVDPSSGLVVGCSAVGPLADELVAVATTLVQFEISIEQAKTQVFAFPTISQVLEVAIADAAETFAEISNV